MVGLQSWRPLPCLEAIRAEMAGRIDDTMVSDVTRRLTRLSLATRVVLPSPSSLPDLKHHRVGIAHPVLTIGARCRSIAGHGEINALLLRLERKFTAAVGLHFRHALRIRVARVIAIHRDGLTRRPACRRTALRRLRPCRRTASSDARSGGIPAGLARGQRRLTRLAARYVGLRDSRRF